MSNDASGSVLAILRGNSGSGKTTIACEVQKRLGRGVAARIGQDQLRREILRERDLPGGLAPAFICDMAAYLLERMPVVIVEGIMATPRYRDALAALIVAHPGPGLVYWMDVDLAETCARHDTRPGGKFSKADMASWYVEGDLLGTPGELVIPQESTLEETVVRICADVAAVGDHALFAPDPSHRVRGRSSGKWGVPPKIP